MGEGRMQKPWEFELVAQLFLYFLTEVKLISIRLLGLISGNSIRSMIIPPGCLFVARAVNQSAHCFDSNVKSMLHATGE